jgi:hypothetical protein
VVKFPLDTPKARERRLLARADLGAIPACSVCESRLYGNAVSALAAGWSLTVAVSTGRSVLRCPRCDAGETTRECDG